MIFQLDVTSKDALENIRSEIRKKGVDTIDVCIANAGVASKNHPYDPAWTCPEDDLLKTFQTNTMGTLFTAQSLAPLLSMSKKAKLFVGISSRFGSLSEAVGVGGYTSYRISKAAMNMACVCMAHDPSMMGIGIKFLCLHPGWVETDMVSSSPLLLHLHLSSSSPLSSLLSGLSWWSSVSSHCPRELQWDDQCHPESNRCPNVCFGEQCL
jgi:NAD(P)-dependent dehydrogenase (short-subunit alcohol dehydrogenase family)